MCEKSMGKNIHILSRQLKREIDLQVVKYGITGVQSVLLQFVYENSKDRDVFAKDMEKEFDLSRASIAGILQNMEKNGLIKRQTINNDARLRKIILTNKALKIREEIERNIGKVEERAIKGLSKEDVKKYIELTKKMSLNLERRG